MWYTLHWFYQQCISFNQIRLDLVQWFCIIFPRIASFQLCKFYFTSPSSISHLSASICKIGIMWSLLYQNWKKVDFAHLLGLIHQRAIPRPMSFLQSIVNLKLKYISAIPWQLIWRWNSFHRLAFVSNFEWGLL